MSKKYDFSGYATRYNIRCADGRTILPGCFSHQNGTRVPVVFQHNHKDISQVVGHADLEERPDGMYARVSLNNTANGQNAREQIANGDYDSLSIWANELEEYSGNVAHGMIKELSLVLSGANPGAYIDNLAFAHSNGMIEDMPDQAIIYSGDQGFDYGDDISHSDDDSVEAVLATLDDEQAEAVTSLLDLVDEYMAHDSVDGEFDYDYMAEVLSTLDDNQKQAVLAIIGSMSDDEIGHDDMDDDGGDDMYGEEGYEYEEGYDNDDAEVDMDAIEDTLDTLNDEQADVVESLFAMADGELGHDGLDDWDDDYVEGVLDTLDDDQATAVAMMLDMLGAGDEMGHSDLYDDEEDVLMHTNLFDTGYEGSGQLAMDEVNAIIHDAMESKASSLKDCFLAHADGDVTNAANYGIGNIEYLFPDARNMDVPPTFIKRDMDWVKVVMNGVHHTAFSRVKSMFADITEDEARALGYIKGNLKKEEFFSLATRTTTPQTIYKKQKLDRDDIVDITDFSVVVWLKAEMRMMLEEEIARAILIGDGRSSSSADKIKEEHVRPIWTDAELFTIRLQDETVYDSADARAKAFIRLALKNRKQLKGSGNPSLFITEDLLTDMLLLEDGIGRTLYDTVEKLATKLRVKEIISVPVMENKTRTVGEGAAAKTWQIGMIFVNLADYNVGADKGGAVEMFNDFDIDYNQEKYLMETRFSGALIKPKSAMVLEYAPNNVQTGNDSSDDGNNTNP